MEAITGKMEKGVRQKVGCPACEKSIGDSEPVAYWNKQIYHVFCTPITGRRRDHEFRNRAELERVYPFLKKKSERDFPLFDGNGEEAPF